VRGLVEMHGGSIEARSAGIGQGSEFIVRLPILLEPKPPGPQVNGEAGKTNAVCRCRVLVVDDNKDSATSLARLLKLMGNSVRTAHDGLEAVNAAAEFKPDVALLDIGLPKLNGYDAARAIRDEPWGKSMVLIALTGWGQDEDKRRALEAGFHFHMVKPVDLRALENLLAQLRPVPA
jgi:CheY-like chemotaxis protein